MTTAKRAGFSELFGVQAPGTLVEWFDADGMSPEGWDVIVAHLDPEDIWDANLTGLRHP